MEGRAPKDLIEWDSTSISEVQLELVWYQPQDSPFYSEDSDGLSTPSVVSGYDPLSDYDADSESSGGGVALNPENRPSPSPPPPSLPTSSSAPAPRSRLPPLPRTWPPLPLPAIPEAREPEDQSASSDHSSVEQQGEEEDSERSISVRSFPIYDSDSNQSPANSPSLSLPSFHPIRSTLNEPESNESENQSGSDQPALVDPAESVQSRSVASPAPSPTSRGRPCSGNSSPSPAEPPDQPGPSNPPSPSPPAESPDQPTSFEFGHQPRPPDLVPATYFETEAEMSSKSKETQSSGGFYQDYIASLRYRNDLPPPEMATKFLEIPHEGLSRFITPGFAANLARREEPNIDVDAEGGMPIDLVGIPGLHLGDESAIMAPENPQPIDPADLPLLMTLEQLRNPAPKNTNVSFLRRTQHISVDRSAPAGAGTTPAKAQGRAGRRGNAPMDDPKHVKKYIQKGFDIAYPGSKHTGEDTESRIRGLPATKMETDAWAKPSHPDNPKLKPVGFLPLMPDLQGFSDPGGYVQFKFDKAPVAAISGKRDKRMEVALLHPSAPEQRVCEDYANREALHKANPETYPEPGPIPWNYDLYLPEKPELVKNIRASMDPNDPNREDEGLYTNEGPDGKKFHRFDRIRTYATSAQLLNPDLKYRDIAITVNKPAKGDSKQLGAYYYPILGKTRLKPERTRNIAQAGLLSQSAGQDKDDQVDQIQVTVREPNELEAYKRALHRAQVDPKFNESLPPPPPEMPEEEEEQAHAEAEQPGDGETAEKSGSHDDDTRMSDA